MAVSLISGHNLKPDFLIWEKSKSEYRIYRKGLEASDQLAPFAA
jgi:hypothetical protein